MNIYNPKQIFHYEIYFHCEINFLYEIYFHYEINFLLGNLLLGISITFCIFNIHIVADTAVLIG